MHIVTHGEAWLYIQQEVIKVQAGDILFFPRSHQHRLSHQPESENSQSEDFPILTEVKTAHFQLKHTAGMNSNFSMFCAHFSYTPPADLFQNLPHFIHVPLPQTQFEAVIYLLQQEAARAQQSGQKIIDALSEILLIYILREYLEQQSGDAISGILKSWKTSKLGPLIENILEHPTQDWSLEQMASTIFVSRIQLIRFFKRELDITPHAFVTQIRLQHAAQQLRKSNRSILHIALDLGFQTETHFGRSFKRYYKLTPHKYRFQTQD